MRRARPAVSVVVPFAGGEAELARLIGALGALRLDRADEVIIADNVASAPRRDGGPEDAGPPEDADPPSDADAPADADPPAIRVIDATGRRTPAHARNRGAALATGEWLLFIDADTIPSEDLVERYFEQLPDARAGVLAGAVRDVARRPTLSATHSTGRAHMSQQTTLNRPVGPYAQTANCAVRRIAFESVGGFADEARAGEDADLCLRLAAAGWRIEPRPNACVEHGSRESLAGLLAQMARHGSGAAWVNRRYPGTFPRPTLRGFTARLGRDGAAALAAAARGQREIAMLRGLDVATACAFEFGRLLPNSVSPFAEPGRGPRR